MIEISRTREGPVFRIRARPGGSRRCAGGEHQGALKVQTTVPPEKGKANSDILKIVARALGVRKSQVTLAAGARGRDKEVLVLGIDPDELQERLNALAAGERGD